MKSKLVTVSIVMMCLCGNVNAESITRYATLDLERTARYHPPITAAHPA
jgi:hypothetical protein